MKVLDLFSGCGGLSLGFQNAGHNIVAAYDSWELATQVYSDNFEHPCYCMDLSNIEASLQQLRRHEVDIIIGGPPCQDFSIAGNRKEKDRANLTISFANIVARLEPQFVVMENVYNIEKSKSLQEALSTLSQNGYGITKRIVDASLVGVPQKRRRFFLVAAKTLPDDAFGPALDQCLGNTPTTIADYFGNELGTNYYYAHPRSYKRRAVFSIDEPSATIRRVNRPIPDTYKKHPADKACVRKDHVRPLTTEERSRVQTFPADYKFSGSKSQKEELIANAVPPLLGEYLARQIYSVINDHDLSLLTKSPKPKISLRK